MKKLNRLKNNGGFLTVDYLFSFCIVCGFAMIIMAFSATLSMVEVVQYMAFSTARNYFAGNLDEATQISVAQAKLASLASDPTVRPLIAGGWFFVDIANTTIKSDYPEYSGTNAVQTRNLFEGVVIPFTANILAMQIPLFGSTVKSDAKSIQGGAFQTKITAFVGREVTYKECDAFMLERWEKIKALTGAASHLSNGTTGQVYYDMNDNGC